VSLRTQVGITYHTLFWLDLYLTGKTEGFAPPAHFRNPLDPASEFPTQPYTRDELHTYLKQLRQKCQATITALSDEQAHQPFYFPWDREHPISFFELQLYTMRHVQEHAARASPLSRASRPSALSVALFASLVSSRS
jgi:DinB superfamily